METQEKIKLLRAEMKEKGLNAYIIGTFDPHMSEYIPDAFKEREWITGFTGSQGTAVITEDYAALWADGRYYIQAENQIKGSEFKLMKLGKPQTPTISEWLKTKLKEKDVVGLNGELYPHNALKALKKDLKQKKISVNSEDLISPIWEDRPDMPCGETFILDTKYAGKSAKEKIEKIRMEMKKEGGDVYLISSLDNIAWTYNIRGKDVANNPVVISYALIGREDAHIYLDEKKLTNEVKKSLEENGITTKKYEEIYKDIENLKNVVLLFDGNKTNDKLISFLKDADKKNIADIADNLKAIKNETEIKNQYLAYIKDGVALTKLFMWIEKELPWGITEADCADKAHEFRISDPDFIEESFDSISAYGENAAMMHYNHNNGTPATLSNSKFYLLDSGGQYLYGTTDITRTISLGELTYEEKRDYTLTLQSMIRLSMLKFLEGTTGAMMDSISRANMWEYGMDYKCGTGHGVGYFLNVHEGPQRISRNMCDKVPFKPGMVTSNEPGVYKEGKHGIRIENIMHCVEDSETPDGAFYKFETFTRVYIDTRPVIKEILSDKEINWLNEYHKKVYEDLSPYLNDKEKEFLKEKTRAI